ncbi:SDR family NAD(P)-dependent oxidoreductase [Limimaricola pyoseonensis]|nr:SDR family NAD(P)-dependent oxidoreductase [Limimaricola pyoseonensis]
MRDWQGKRYWLVGASEGLGRELAFCLSRAGVELVLSARNAERLRSLSEALPGRAEVLPLDVRDTGAVSAAAERAGEIDGLAYLAGVYWPMRAQGWDEAKVEEMADINYLGATRVVGAALPGMRRRGRGHIVLTGAISGFRGLPGTIGYGASKAAVMHLAESLQHDLQGSGVEVQLVNPGYVRTRMTDKNDHPMPFIMEPARAAREYFEHMSSDRFKLNYPYGVSLLYRGTQFLPDWAYFRLFNR